MAIENQIRIVGHTDNSKPIDPKYSNNWDLSTGRAIVIADYLISKGISPDRLTVSGRGEYQPVFPNDTLEHRSLNSRADIVVIYKSAADKVIDGASAIVGSPANPQVVIPTTPPTTGGSH